jgi:hypothetical protein
MRPIVQKKKSLKKPQNNRSKVVRSRHLHLKLNLNSVQQNECFLKSVIYGLMSLEERLEASLTES